LIHNKNINTTSTVHIIFLLYMACQVLPLFNYWTKWKETPFLIHLTGRGSPLLINEKEFLVIYNLKLSFFFEIDSFIHYLIYFFIVLDYVFHLDATSPHGYGNVLIFISIRIQIRMFECFCMLLKKNKQTGMYQFTYAETYSSELIF